MNISFFKELFKYKVLLLMLLPAVIYFFIFSYIPMAGIVLAFKNYDYQAGIFGSQWTGLNNFKFFFMSGNAFNVTKNTILYNIAFLTINTTLQMSTAIFLSEIRNKFFKRIAQSTMFLPYFISWIVVSAFIFNFFNYKSGTLNTMLISLGSEPFDAYSNTSIWKYVLAFFSAWKSVGYGSILYLSAIMGIDSSLYEAAMIEGANIFQRIRHITIPLLMPTMIVLILMAIGGIFRGDFQMFYQIIGENGLLYNATDVIDTFVFRALIKTQDVGMSSAAGFYQSILCFSILMITNYAVKRVNPDYALF